MKTVLHVLPHPGGGGETYVDALARMEGYRFERVFLARSPKPAPAALRGGVSAMLAARRYDLIHVHGEVASGICLPALAICPSVVTLHGLHLFRRMARWARPAAAVNLRLVVRVASATVCVAEAERAEVVEAVGQRAAQRVVVIHNGIEPMPSPSLEDRALARAALGLSPEATVGVFVGSLDDRKDPFVAARAAAAVAREGVPFVLLLVGDGPLRAELERFASENGSVRVVGFRDDVPALLAAADLFVLPSRREGFSYSVLEAMAAGLPAIVSDAPGLAEEVGGAGIVVPCGDTEGFADAFRKLMDSRERAALGAQARERVRRSFTLAQMLRDTHNVYAGALGEPSPVRIDDDSRASNAE
jgi:glycosyltransferase involved in cell wall biosynthesis